MTAIKPELEFDQLKLEAEAVFSQCNALFLAWKGALADKSAAVKAGDARAADTAERAAKVKRDGLIHLTGELEEMFGPIESVINSDFTRDRREIEKNVRPVRERILALRAELVELERREKELAEFIADDVAAIDARKSFRDSWLIQFQHDVRNLGRRVFD